MNTRNRLVRVARAISGLTQKGFAAKAGLDAVVLGQYETGVSEPGAENLELALKGAGLTVADGIALLRYADALRQPRTRAGQGEGDLPEFAVGLMSAVYRRLLRLPPLDGPPTPGDRRRAADLWSRLQQLSAPEALGVAKLSPSFHCWALAELLCHESARQASRDLDRAATLAQLAEAIAARICGPAGWPQRVQGYAAAHAANVLRAGGQLEAAAELSATAWRLWH